jgi:hypothetical protein
MDKLLRSLATEAGAGAIPAVQVFVAHEFTFTPKTPHKLDYPDNFT